MLLSCLAYSSFLMMEAICSSQRYADFLTRYTALSEKIEFSVTTTFDIVLIAWINIFIVFFRKFPHVVKHFWNNSNFSLWLHLWPSDHLLNDVFQQYFIIWYGLYLWWWYINMTIIILDIIQRPVSSLKHNVLEIGFCPPLQVVRTRLGPIDKVSSQLDSEE
jgi:hypothetical protein